MNLILFICANYPFLDRKFNYKLNRPSTSIDYHFIHEEISFVLWSLQVRILR